MIKENSQKRNILIFILFLSLFIIFRLAILCTSLDELFDSEELYRGAIAKEIIEGKKLPLMDYLYTDYEGGSLVTGIAAVPFFLLMGKSYLSLKMVTFVTSAFIFSLWYWIFLKYFSSSSAYIFSLLMLFPVPSLLKISLTSWGNHFESAFFSTLMLCFLLKVMDKNAESENPDLFISLAGILFGFGIFYSYSLAPQALAIFIAFIFLAPRLFFGKIHILTISAIIGYLPGIYFNITHNFAGLSIKGKSLKEILSSSQTQADKTGRLIDFISKKIPESACFSGEAFVDASNSQTLLAFIYITAFILTLLFIVKLIRKNSSLSDCESTGKEKNIKQLLVAFSAFLYPLIFVFLYTFTAFKISTGYKDYFGFRYMAPVLFYIIIVITLSLFFLLTRSKYFYKFTSIIILSVTILINANYDLKLIKFTSPVNAAQFKGYDYFWLGQVLVFRYGFELSKSVSVASIFNGKAKHQCFEGLGFKYAWSFLSRNKSEEKKLEGTDSKSKANFYKGLGTALSYYSGRESNSDNLKEITEEKIPKQYQKNFYRGFGLLMPFSRKGEYDSFFISYNESLIKFLSKGIGEGITKKNGFNNEKISNDISKLPLFLKDYAVIGVNEYTKEMSF